LSMMLLNMRGKDTAINMVSDAPIEIPFSYVSTVF